MVSDPSRAQSLPDICALTLTTPKPGQSGCDPNGTATNLAVQAGEAHLVAKEAEFDGGGGVYGHPLVSRLSVRTPVRVTRRRSHLTLPAWVG